MTNVKTYWSLLKTFYNGKKLPIIPSLLIDNKVISDFEVKINHFNNFFVTQRTQIITIKFLKTKLTQQILPFFQLNLRIEILLI